MAQSGAGIAAAQNREAVLVAHNAAAANADSQLQTLLRSAHDTKTQYSRRLDAIEAAINEAVARQSTLGLDTPAGARQFQQFLMAKHAQIMAVLADAQRSDAEQSAQMTALAAQYKTSLGDDDWFYGEGPEYHPVDPGGAAAGPNAGPRVPDSVIRPTSFSTSSGGWDEPAEPWRIGQGFEEDEFGHFHPPVLPVDPGGAAAGGGGGGRAPV